MTPHKIKTDLNVCGPNHPFTEGGPEVEITFRYVPASGEVLSGPLAGPAEPHTVEYVRAVFTHGNTPVDPDTEETLIDWLEENIPKAFNVVTRDKEGDPS